MALEASGVDVRVAAATTDIATPHWNSGQGSDGGIVTPDLALADVNSEDYSAIAFTGGWGMAQYEYGFEGSYGNSTYQGDLATKELVNTLVNEFVEQDKYVMVASGSVGDPNTVEDDVIVDGRIITAENYDSAAYFGEVVARELLANA